MSNKPQTEPANQISERVVFFDPNKVDAALAANIKNTQPVCLPKQRKQRARNRAGNVEI
jgi:hypothetical protein